MEKTQAQISSKKIAIESAKLQVSPVVYLFEIDLSDLAFDASLTFTDSLIFRFHNNVKLFNRNIYWQGKEFFPAPIQVTGFEWGSQGILPTPRMSISIGESDNPIFTSIREKIYSIGDIIGAKVTRIVTFAKHLDEENYFNIEPPADFDPDPNAEFPREVYEIDRKTSESSNTLEYELVSSLDTRSKKLPGRLVIANKCPFRYRGEGCCYEFSGRKESIHGKATLPTSAPAVANDRNELIKNIIGKNPQDKGEYIFGVNYKLGDSVFIQRGDLKYYFVANKDNPIYSPPNLRDWISDSCAKDITGCEIRYGLDGSAFGGITKGVLRFGGFPAVSKLQQ